MAYLDAKKLLINNSLDDVNNSLQKFNKLDNSVKDPDFLGVTQQLNEIKQKALQELANIKNNSSQLATIDEASKYENNIQEVQEKFVKDLIKIFDGNINTDRIKNMTFDEYVSNFNKTMSEVEKRL